MAFIPALVIPGMSIARVVRTLSSDERDSGTLTAQETRKQSVVDRMMAGATPPVSYWDEKHLEKMIKTNSAFRDRADELRSARVGSSVCKVPSTASSAGVPDSTGM